MSNIIYFVGGGADKTRERFGIVKWGPTHLMGIAKADFDLRKGPYSKTKYFGYLDKKKIIQDIVKQKLANPDIRINLIGHSRGGAVVKDIAMKELRKLNIKANIVVSLDPVKAKHTHRFRIHSKKGIKNLKTYICIFAKPRKKDPTDYIAMVGGQYGHRLKELSHHYIEVDLNHGQPMPMMKVVVNAKGKSVYDILLKESNRDVKKKS
jgi:hypothetical protein